MAVTHVPVGAGHDEDSDHDELPSNAQQHPHPHSQPALHQHSLSNASTATVDIEAWTVAALESLSIAPVARGTGNALSIPLDGDALPGQRESTPHNGAGGRGTPSGMKLRGVAFDHARGPAAPYGAAITPPRRPPSRRDSMRRRDALLKGKEGSRQRRRWENDHLLHVPNVVPPLPSDWQICPTHRVLPPVPYQLAQYWDKGLRERAEAEKQRRRQKQKRNTEQQQQQQQQQQPEVGFVPRDLRNTAKRTPAVKSWLRALEEPVRAFVVERGLAVPPGAAAAAAARENESGECESDTDSDDEEIVFVGRNARNARDGKSRKKAQRSVAQQHQQHQQHQQLGEEERGMVLEMDDEGGGGAFKRWLTHSISDYYGLHSESVMVGNPARRVVYVGVKQKQKQAALRQKPPNRPLLPPPLWEMF
ncbi:hypothetical protein L209DRAFT_178339 [Thermothelomyces heterothallicus CBS 203.75]